LAPAAHNAAPSTAAEHSGRQAARVKGKVMLELSPSDCWMSPAAATDSREDAAGRKTHICE
ncbi:TPA: hypothetical protein ACQROA_004948, partial [Pseudomonas aeruginosa]